MTTSIKKPFQELVDLLEANKDKKVSAILPQVLELAESKKKDSTVRYDDNGNVTHIFCWYHKEWEPVEWYGKKASSHSGYNTMCKQGVNSWTSQRREAEKKRTQLLKDVSAGKVDPKDLNDLMSEIEEDRKKIIPRSTEE